MEHEQERIGELSRHAAAHCLAAFTPASDRVGAAIEGGSLPYHALGSKGLERLCFQILLADRLAPRFFGRPGQAQYGIDLVVTSPERKTTVVQCKNLAEPPGPAELRKLVTKFETEWLGQADLPRPDCFVLCCSQPLVDREPASEWSRLEHEFPERTGEVRIESWDRHWLDGRLRNLPDVVADQFSDRHVWAFCQDPDQWHLDLFVPLDESQRLARGLRRYFDCHEAGRIYVDPAYAKRFEEILDREPAMVIRGLPGTGKTVTGLALARACHQGRWRVYYLDLRSDGVLEDVILQGIRRRQSRPTLLVLDNCHDQPDLLDRASGRWAQDLRTGRLAIVCLLRHTPAPEEDRGDVSEFVAEREEAEAVLEFENTPERFRAVIARAKPGLGDLSDEQLHRVLDLTGRDLLVLDELLRQVHSGAELEAVDREALYRAVRRAYFGQAAVDLPVVERLAALAQFEIAPPVRLFSDLWTEGEHDRVRSLMVQAGMPARYYFLHSSQAELVFHALVDPKRSRQAGEVAEHAANLLVDYFHRLTASQGPERPSPQAVAAEIHRVVTNRLKLLDLGSEWCLKARFLGDRGIFQTIEDVSGRVPLLGVLSGCVSLLHSAGSPSANRYAQVLAKRTQEALVSPRVEVCADALSHLPPALSALTQADESLADKVKEQVDGAALLRLIRVGGTIRELFHCIRRSYLGMEADLVEALDEPTVEALTEAAIAAGRSIGTLNLALWDLGGRDRTLLAKLEAKVGAQRLLRLIRAKGTMFEVFHLVSGCSAEMAVELLETLDERAVESLTQATITAGRSIGALNIPLRHLGAQSPTVCNKLEAKVGVARMWRLCVGCGNLRFLAYMTRDMSPGFRRAFAAGSADVPADQWKCMVLAGTFWDVAMFLQECSRHFADTPAEAALAGAIAEAGAQVAASTPWGRLNAACKAMDRCEASPILQAAVDARQKYLDTVRLGDIEGLGLSDAVPAIQCLWWQRKDLRDDLVAMFPNVVPLDKSKWRELEDFFETSRCLLSLLRDPRFPGDAVPAALAMALDETLAERFAQTKAMHLFLHYWDAFSLWYERVSNHVAGFQVVLPEATSRRLLAALARRIPKKSQQPEPVFRLALAGLWDFLGIDVGEPVRRGLKAWWHGDQKEAWKLATENTFVPAMFALLGLQAAFRGVVGPVANWSLGAVFTPAVCRNLLANADKYPNVTPSIKYLRSLLE